jgi:hypothetical protein
VRRVVASLSALLLAATSLAVDGWSTSPTIVLPRTRYPVYGTPPPCAGVLLVDESVGGALARVGVRPVDATSGQPTPVALAIGRVMNTLGMGMMRQDHGTCAEVCAVVPLDATRVTALVGYASRGLRGPFHAEPFGHAGHYFMFDADVDTSRVTERGRLVCAHARNWDEDDDRRVFLVVGYER